MINIANLTHHLGGRTILNDVNLTIPDGTIMGLVGINGAGKSTLLRLLAGVYLPDEGTVQYNGISPEEEVTRETLFFLPDDPYFTHQATIKSVLAIYEPLYPNIHRGTYRRLIDQFKLNEKAPLRTFSKGMRRQAYIAIALAIRPKYLLLDEAFDGLDPLSRQTVKEELIHLVEEENTTVIISSHSLRELEDFCDRYTMIDHMTVTSSGDIAEKVTQYCKFMLAFSDEIPQNIFEGLPLLSVQKSGRFIRGVFEGDSKAIGEALARFSPTVMEELPMDFEEAFIQEVTRRRDP